jgi:hypothetical protein
MINLWALVPGSGRSDEAETGRFVQGLESGKMEHARSIGRRLGRRGGAKAILAAARASLARNLRHADVLLDSLHFGGGNTSLEGFSVGTPIVTLPGEFMRGRHTLSMYRATEIADCIANSLAHYVELAVKLGTDSSFRRDVGNRIEARSPILYEDERVARELERAFVTAARASHP